MSGRGRTSRGLPGHGSTKRVHTLQLPLWTKGRQVVRFFPLIDATELEKLASAGNITSPLRYIMCNEHLFVQLQTSIPTGSETEKLLCNVAV